MLEKLICKFFGHKNSERHDGVNYLKVIYSTTDADGRPHLFLQAKCVRCKACFRAGILPLDDSNYET